MTFCAVCQSEVLLGRQHKSPLQYGNLKFYLSVWTADKDEDQDHTSIGTKPLFRLHCDVHFGNHKGNRLSSPRWQDQPLYSHGEEACLDPTLLLAHLAELNNVFPEGITIASIMQTMDLSYFDSNDFLVIPMQSEAKEQFIFCNFYLKRKKDQLPTWAVLPDKPWSTNSSYHSSCMAAQTAGLVGFMPYSLRCLTINALDWPDMTSGAKTIAVGHSASSKCMEVSYLSRRTTLDIQGIVMKGKECKLLIVAQGLQQLQVESLNHSKLLYPSGVFQRSESLSIMQEHLEIAAAERAAHNAALWSELQTRRSWWI